MKYQIIIVILLFYTFGCSIKNKTKLVFQEKISQIRTKEDLKKIETILVIPGAGCPGCVSSAEQFVKDVIDQSDNLLVIFTAFHSRKILKMKLGIELEIPKFHLDEENIFNMDATYSFYPTIYYLKNGNVTDFEYSDPNNYDALDLLKKTILR